jgi:hypothetical protein
LARNTLCSRRVFGVLRTEGTAIYHYAQSAVSVL